MKRIFCAVLAVCILLTAAACRPKEDPFKGYTTQGDISGGVPLDHANARDVSVWQNEDSTYIKLTFNVGSRMSGGGEEAPASTSPSYKIYPLSYPSRLVVEFESLEYADYEHEEFSPAGCVLGSFLHRIEGEDKACIYFQLSADAAFKAFSSGNQLEIEIKPMPKPEEKKGKEQQRFIATANAYRDLCGGRLADIPMTPSLDASLQNVLLVSGIMDSDITAELFINDTVAKCPNAVREEWTVQPIEYGGRPQYDASLGYMAAYSETVARIDEETATAQVFIPDGWYLTDLPKRSGGGSLYSRRTVISDMSSEYDCEMLWVMKADGTSEAFLDYEFQTVESAAFSPDGRRLAVLERAAEATNLYIFDVETEELSANLTDMGFGDMVSAYTWDDLGTTLYAVSGTDMMLVHQYDFNVPVESKRHGVVEKNGADEGCIAYCDGNVYFVQGDMDKGDVIYRVKCDGGVRKSFTEGSSFELSPNNKYMAINAESGMSAASTASAKFRLYDMQTGENITVTDEFGPQSFIWSKDGTKLYYFENRLSGEGGESSEGDTQTKQDDYPYTLWMYDVATEKNSRIGDFPTTSIYPGETADSVYMTYSDSDTMGERVKATYRIVIDIAGR